MYTALNHDEIQIMLKLVQYLDINQANIFDGPVMVNYAGTLHKALFEIISKRGSYENFEIVLHAIVEDVAKLLLQNAETCGFVETKKSVKKDNNCLIS